MSKPKLSWWARRQMAKKKGDSPSFADTTKRVSNLQTKHPISWTVDDVAFWVGSVGYKQYSNLFAQNRINGEQLITIQGSDMASMGVRALGDRKGIAKHIVTLRKNFAPSSSSGVSSEDSEGGSDRSTGSSKGGKEKDKFKAKCFLKGNCRLVFLKKGISYRKAKIRIQMEYETELKIWVMDGEDKIRIENEEQWTELVHYGDEVKLHLEEESVTKSERSVLNGILDAALLINQKGIIQFANKACKKYLGYSSKELVGKNVKMLVNPEIRDKHDGYLRAFAKSGKSKIIGKGRHVKAVRKDGEIIPCWLSITERKKGGKSTLLGTLHPLEGGEGSVTTATSSRWAVLDAILRSVVVINTVGVIQFANRAMESLSGHPTVSLIGNKVNMLMPEPYNFQHDNYLSNYQRTGKSKIIGTSGRNVVLKTKESGLLPISLEVSELVLDGERFFIGLLTKAEKKVRHKSIVEEARGLIESLAVPALIINAKGLIQAANSHSLDMFGYDLVDVVGQNIKMLMNDKDAGKHDGYLSRYVETREARVIGKKRQMLAKHANGSLFKMTLSVTVREDHATKSMIFIGMVLPSD